MGNPWKRRTKFCDACQRDITVKRGKTDNQVRFIKHTKSRDSKSPCRNSGGPA